MPPMRLAMGSERLSAGPKVVAARPNVRKTTPNPSLHTRPASEVQFAYRWGEMEV